MMTIIHILIESQSIKQPGNNEWLKGSTVSQVPISAK